jgi:hypothetical protein
MNSEVLDFKVLDFIVCSFIGKLINPYVPSFQEYYLTGFKPEILVRISSYHRPYSKIKIMLSTRIVLSMRWVVNGFPDNLEHKEYVIRHLHNFGGGHFA